MGGFFDILATGAANNNGQFPKDKGQIPAPFRAVPKKQPPPRRVIMLIFTYFVGLFVLNLVLRWYFGKDGGQSESKVVS
jgi:hypothetical protein